MKSIAVLGSTGSVGENVLRIARIHPDKFSVRVLAAKKNVKKLYEQALEFKPKIVCVYETKAAQKLEKKLKRHKIKVVTGDEGLLEVSTYKGVKEVICAMVGGVGLKPIFAAVRSGKDIAVANKEPLVMAGKLLLREAKKRKVNVLPIDSEHSALWQCLENQPLSSVKKLILTSSGGPFHNKKGTLSGITLKQALNHPKWKMGPKITIDSATLMNKGLEVIEAANLFNVSPEKIDVLIHPEAIIHAMVEFVDGSYFAHLGVTDMKLPIQYAMSYPERLDNHLPKLNFANLKTLNFSKPDSERFPCLKLGYEASKIGGTLPAALNAANEIAVGAFLNKKIKFLQIPKIIESIMSRHRLIKNPSLTNILNTDLWVREETESLL